MTVAHVQNHTGGQTKTTGTTLTVALAANVASGNTLVLHSAIDNLSGTTTPDISSITVPGGESATWVQLGTHDAPTSTGANSLIGETWAITTTQEWLSSFTPTITYSGSRNAKSAVVAEFSGVTTTLRGSVALGTSTTGSPTATATGPLSGDLVIGGGSFETATTPTGDSDTTNGSWSTILALATSGGLDQSNVTAVLQYKIVTGTGSQTYNPTGTSNDSGVVVAALAAIPPAVTGTLASTTDAATLAATGEHIGAPLADHFYTNDTNLASPTTGTFEKAMGRSTTPGNTTATHRDTTATTGTTHMYRSGQAHTSATWPTGATWTAGINLDFIGPATTVAVALLRANADGTGFTGAQVNLQTGITTAGVYEWTSVTWSGVNTSGSTTDTLVLRVTRSTGTGDVSVRYDDTRTYVYDPNLTDPASGASGTLSSTLSGATLAGAGWVEARGTLAATLADATLMASGTETINGSLTATLDDSTLAATGTETISGAAATTLAGAELAATGTQTFTGTLATTLADSTLAGSGTETITGTSATTLADSTLAASGTVTSAGVDGTLAAQLDNATLAGAGTQTIAGELTTTLAGAALSASGAESFAGTLSATLDDTTLAASGILSISGTVTSTLSDATLSATGTATVPGATGTLETTLADAILVATGALTITGTIGALLDAASLVGAGFAIDTSEPTPASRTSTDLAASRTSTASTTTPRVSTATAEGRTSTATTADRTSTSSANSRTSN